MPLVAGWREATTADGKRYFTNARLKTTAWARPVEFAASPPPHMPGLPAPTPVVAPETAAGGADAAQTSTSSTVLLVQRLAELAEIRALMDRIQESQFRSIQFNTPEMTTHLEELRQKEHRKEQHELVWGGDLAGAAVGENLNYILTTERSNSDVIKLPADPGLGVPWVPRGPPHDHGVPASGTADGVKFVIGFEGRHYAAAELGDDFPQRAMLAVLSNETDEPRDVTNVLLDRRGKQFVKQALDQIVRDRRGSRVRGKGGNQGRCVVLTFLDIPSHSCRHLQCLPPPPPPPRLPVRV